MDRVTVVIVDDEQLARKGLKTLVERRPEFVVSAVCANGREAITRIGELAPDVILLDIQMPEITGFDVLAQLPSHLQPAVIFVTAYDEHAVRAFDARALDYVLKPVSPPRLDAALDRAIARIRDRKLAEYGKTLLDAVAALHEGPAADPGSRQTRSPWLERLMIKDGDAIHFVEVQDIEWIEGADYYVTVHAGGKPLLCRESLKHLEERLDPATFLRIHVSAIVNLAKVREIRRGFGGDLTVTLASGARLPVSRRRKKELLDLGTARFGLKG